MASETSICNMALSRVGHDFITSLTEDTKPGRLCNLHYQPSRDSVLRAHPWNFAIRRVALALSVDVPAFEFEHQFAIPSDCLKIIRTISESEQIYDKFRIEGRGDQGGRWLLTNDTACSIEYVAQVTDPNTFDANFVDVLAQRIAAEICVALTDNANMTNSLWEIYQAKLAEARSIDAQEGTPRTEYHDSWLTARL